MGDATQEPTLLLRGEQAARLLNMGRSKTMAMMAAGELPGVVRIGRSIRISRAALERWVEEQVGKPGEREDKAA
jgi:excisionase family DNA binding protein